VGHEVLRGQLREILAEDPANAPARIEAFLDDWFAGFPPEDRYEGLKFLAETFPAAEAAASPAAPRPSAPPEVGRLFSLVFGNRVPAPDLADGEQVERLAASLNKLFDKLNGVVETINATLLGRQDELETIRVLLGSSLDGDRGGESLEQYLDRIREAFAVAHQAFVAASTAKVEKILGELDPGKIAGAVEGGLRFGALKKAEQFDLYAERYRSVREWVDQGRFRDELLREFEKECRSRYTPGNGRRKPG
jgi:hypothetical protein